MSESGAPRAVVDTNLFVSGMINPRGRPRRVLRAWYEGRFFLVLSDWQYAGLTDVFSRSKFIRRYQLTPQDLADLFTRIAEAPRVVPSSTSAVPLRDPKDEHILAAAIGGKADYLVTGDNDLLVHQDDPRLEGLKILTATQFLNALEASSPDTGKAS